MEVNVAKCTTISYLIEGNEHRCTLHQELILRGQGVLNLIMAWSLKYLGTAISERRRLRLGAAMAKSMEMEIRVQMIIASRLLAVLKIDAVKRFLFPILDFMTLNDDMGNRQLRKMDTTVRAQMDALLHVGSLLVECHHAL
jgi:hypothetical protein